MFKELHDWAASSTFLLVLYRSSDDSRSYNKWYPSIIFNTLDFNIRPPYHSIKVIEA